MRSGLENPPHCFIVNYRESRRDSAAWGLSLVLQTEAGELVQFLRHRQTPLLLPLAALRPDVPSLNTP